MNRLTLLALGLAAFAVGQSADSPRGRWTGSMDTPNGGVDFVFDIDKTEKGWVGSMAVPAQNVSGIPLGKIRNEGGEWKFSIMGGGNAPEFAGKLSEDGKALSGNFTQGGNSIPLKLTHAGAPKVELPKVSPAVAKEFVGEWEGTLEGPGLRLLAKISNDAEGAKAVLVSLDQGGVEIPVSSVQAKEGRLMLEVRAVDGGYAGQINAEGTELKGEWTQRGQAMALSLKKKTAK